MGRSMTYETSQVLNRISAACRRQTGSSNTIHDHFFEDDGKEHQDDSVRGEIFKMLTGSQCRKVANFKIDKFGKVTGPQWFKDLALQPV